MARRSSFLVDELLQPPPPLQLPDDVILPLQGGDGGSGDDGARLNDSQTLPRRQSIMRPPPPLPPKSPAPLPPGLTLPSDSVAYSESTTKMSSSVSKLAPLLLAEAEEYQRKKDAYQLTLAGIFAEKTRQFDHVFSGYFDSIREAIKELHFPLDLQMEMMRQEYVRVESLKRRLFISTSLSAIEKRIESKQGEIQTVHKIVRAQAQIRGFLQRKKFAAIYKPIKKRNRIVMEILQTEKAYVSNLDTIIHVYYEPLMENGLIDATDVSFIFDSIRTIVSLNKQLLAELEIKVTLTEVRHARIGEVFLKFLPFFKTYTLYVNNYETIQKTIKHLQDKDDDFKIWLAKQARDPRLRGLGLDSYQIMPIQRIPRYELLLKELVSNTDETHPDFPNLKRAVGEVHTIANLINEQKKLSENMMKMLQIQNLMGAKCPDLIQPHRRLVKEGSLDVLVRGSPTPCYVFLFNDALLLTLKDTSFIASNQLSYKAFEMLQSARVEDLADSEGKYGFEIFFQRAVFMFFASDPVKKQQWMTSLRECVAATAQSASSRLSTRFSVSSLKLDDIQRAGAVPSTTSIQSSTTASSTPSHQLRNSTTISTIGQLNTSATSTGAADTKSPPTLEQIYEDVISVLDATSSLPHELQQLLKSQLKNPSALDTTRLASLKERFAAIQSGAIDVETLNKMDSNEVGLVLQQGKQIVTDLKNFIVSNFPGGTTSPVNNTMRQLILKTMKWFVSLEALLTTKDDDN